MKKTLLLILFSWGYFHSLGQNYSSSILTGISEIAGTGTPVTLFASQAISTSSAVLPIGFTFNFYGNPYTEFYINPTGTLSFGSANQNYLSAYYSPTNTIPSTNIPNNFIGFAFINPYDNYPSPNLYPNYSSANVNYFVSGTAPNRILVVNFKNVVIPGSFPIPTRTLNVQTQLSESDGKIEVHNTTNSSPYSPDYNRYDHLQIGIENIDGTEATAVTCAKNWNLNNKTVRFVYCASPGIPTNITNTAICNAGGQQSVSLTATCSSGSPIWYTNVTSNDCIGLITNPTPISNTTVTPTATTLYKVRCENSTCRSPFVISTITVGNTNPVAPTNITKNPTTPITPTTAVTLTASSCASGATVKWNDNSTINPRIVNPSLTTTYTAKCINGACESTTSTSVTVNVNAPTTLTATKPQICVGETTMFTVSGCASGSYGWFPNPTSSPTPNENGLVTGLTQTTIYKVYCYATALYSADYTITVNTPPVRPVITATPAVISTIGGGAMLSASCPNGNLTWYKNGTQEGVGASYAVVNQLKTSIYSVKCTDPSTTCVSTSVNNRLVVEANIAGAATAYNGSYFEGLGSYDYSAVTGVPGARQNVTPYTVDAGTYQFSTVYQVGANYGQIWSGNFIARKGNVWEIVFGQSISTGNYTPPALTYTRKYHTKFRYSTLYPPCSAIWINDADNSEVTLTNTGVCQSENACPAPVTISVNPSLVLGVQSTLSASGCNSPNTLLWSGSLTSTATTIIVTPTAAVSYIATCSSSTCSSAANISLSNVTLTGIATPNGGNIYGVGCFNFTAYFPGGSTPVSICPISPDALTNYYTNGYVQSGQYTGPSNTQIIVRKNNIWRIEYFSNQTYQLTKYHTKYQYNTQKPPCTASWIKDSDGSEVTLNIGGDCQNEVSCPAMAVTSSVASPLPANTQITLTATGCSSPSVVTWNTGATGSTLSLTPTTATTYIATCFGATCSSSIASLPITMQCATVLTLSSTNSPTDDINTGIILKQANSTNGTIAATNKITGTAKVTYQAKNIQLNAGFKADNGTVFKAEVGGCN